MAFKSPPNTRRSWPSEPEPRQAVQINQNLERAIPASPGTVAETSNLSVRHDNPLYPPALREMLEQNDYRIALVSGNNLDFLRKPEVETAAPPTLLLAFSWKELIAQVDDFVRGSAVLPERKIAQFSDVSVDFRGMTVSRLSGEVISLTHQEFKTLGCFLSNPERVLSRDELLNVAWGYASYPTTRTVDNHVAKLRQKLEDDPAVPVHFLTVRGVGYKFLP